MNPYKGVIKIICTKKTPCRVVTGKDVQPGCISCNYAVCEVLDLDGKVLAECRPEPEKPAKKAKTS